MVGMMVERLWSSKTPRVGTPFAALQRARCSRAEGELEYTRPTGTRPQTSPERSGRRGPQVHPVGRLVSTATLHLVGHHPKAKPPRSRRSHISLCSTSHNSECEPSVSAPWMSTEQWAGKGWAEWCAEVSGAVQGSALCCSPTMAPHAFRQRRRRGRKACMFDVYCCRGPEIAQAPIRLIDIGHSP